MGDRYNIHSQLEHLQSKYIGTGHADTNKWEWMTNQHRDSSASYMGHADMLNYFALVENESRARVRFNLMERMLQPCGPPPERPEDWDTHTHTHPPINFVCMPGEPSSNTRLFFITLS